MVHLALAGTVCLARAALRGDLMITGQVPIKNEYSRVERRRALGVSVARCLGSAFAVLMVSSALSASASETVDGRTVEARQNWQIAQDVVVPPVKRQRPGDAPAPAPAPEAKPVAPPAVESSRSNTPPPVADAPGEPDGGIYGVIQDWLARANREYQGVVVKELSSPPTATPDVADDPIARKLDEQQKDDARKAADAKAAADAKTAADKRATDAKRLADDRRRAEETKRLADEASRKADEILKDVNPQTPPVNTAEEQRREAQKLADENRRQEEQHQKEAQRRADDERKRVAAAQATRAEAARADAAKQEAVRLRSEAARVEAAKRDTERLRAEVEVAENKMHRRRTFVLTAEPIERPTDRGTLNRPDLASERVLQDARYASYRPMIVDRPHVGTAVKPWVRRVAPAAKRCHAAGRRVTLPGRYTVKSGDSLWRISKRHYRKGKLYTRIYAANSGRIRNPDLIYPCQRVLVPRKRR